MNFYQPVSPWGVNQHFGQNDACISLDGKNTVITADGNNPPKGFKSLYGKKGHLGLDLRAVHGQPVYASADGVVTFIDTDPKTGLDVKITSKFGGKEYLHIYEHLLGYQVKIGDRVKVGDCIGWADNTGYSAGNHLHFQIDEVVKGKRVPVDPIHLMEPLFALKYAGFMRQIRDLTARLAELIAGAMHR